MAKDSLPDDLGGAEPSEDGAELHTGAQSSSAEHVALQAARADPILAAKAGAYFDSQARMIAVQTEHLHEQRGLLVACLRLKRQSERLRILSQFFIMLAVMIIAAYLLLMVHDALTARSVIVEPFDTAPAMEAQGLSGKVVAGGLLDALTHMQRATQSTVAKRDLANSWSNDIKVEVPETGISIGEIDRLLKRRLGHDVHIGGDLVQTPAGLELTVRGDGIEPKTLTGPPTDLRALIASAGEYVYGQTQPALFALYLARAGRTAETIAFAKQALVTAPRAERPFLLNAWAQALADQGAPVAQILSLERAALALKPDYWTTYANAISDTRSLPDEEAAWRLGETMRHAAGGRPGAAPELAYGTWDLLTGNLLAARAALIADADQHQGVGSVTGTAAPAIAGFDIQLHDLDDAKLQLATFDLQDPYVAAAAHYIRAGLAEAAGDPKAALAEYQAWAQANADPAISQGDQSYHCALAAAQLQANLPGLAEASAKAGGNFVDCARVHADILDQQGNWAAAQRAYAAALALAPDLPEADLSWGLALARHNDLAGAVQHLAAAHRHGPHWADPLKAWGDVLARMGRPGQARAKYTEALQYAPAWQELRQALAAVNQRA